MKARAPRAPRKPAGKPGEAAGASPGPGWREAVGGLGRGALALVRSEDLGRALLSVALVGGFGWASLRARERVLAEPGVWVERKALAATPLPRFLSERARDDLAALAIPESVCAFDPALVPVLACKLARVPWVDAVDSVKVTFVEPPSGGDFGARVHFSLVAARPIARIRERGADVLVSRSRRRIPEDRWAGAARPLPRVEGLPEETSPGREPSLDDALGLLAALEQRGLPAKLGLERVVLSGGLATLVLEKGARVEWGQPGDMPGLSVEDRLRKLEGFLAKGPPLEQVDRVSVRWDDPVYVLRPVPAAPGGPLVSRAP